MAAHDVDYLIDNLTATVVSKEAYKAMNAVHSDFTSDDPNKIEVVTDALVKVLNRFSSKYDPPAVHVEPSAPDRRKATIPTPRAPSKPVEAVEVPTESGPAKKRRRLDDSQARPEQAASVPFFLSSIWQTQWSTSTGPTRREVRHVVRWVPSLTQPLKELMTGRALKTGLMLFAMSPAETVMTSTKRI